MSVRVPIQQSAMSGEYLQSLLRELCALPRESEWVEFKVDKAEPKEIGEYISALANSAALVGKAFSYLVWGVEDATHEVVGTRFDPHATKVGNEELESWLLRLLTPKADFRFLEALVDGRRVVFLEIARASREPVRFEGREFIRVGSYKKPLKDFAEKERTLWRIFDQTSFEDGVAVARGADEEVLRLLDYPSYFELLNRPLPEARAGVLGALADDGVIRRSDAGGWDVSNLGAVLFARRLSDFGRLGRKAMRVVVYPGVDRTRASREEEFGSGYGSGFAVMVRSIGALVPVNELMGQALRRTLPMYPEVAIRELVANALIHQDFAITGSGPMVEIFLDRVEITNPGAPLVDADRFLDTPPRSRNEGLASLMRRMGICEERGSGIDKVISAVEFYQLPAPLFERHDQATRVVLFGHRPLSRMDAAERIRACYQHACLRYVSREFMTNTTLRSRFGIEPRNSAIASRLIKEAVEAGEIVPADEGAAKKLMRYVPWWAGATPRARGGRS